MVRRARGFAASLVGRERTICETEAGDVRITQT